MQYTNYQYFYVYKRQASGELIDKVAWSILILTLFKKTGFERKSTVHTF